MVDILILIPDSFKIQSKYDLDSDVILSLLQINFRYAPDADAILTIIQTHQLFNSSPGFNDSPEFVKDLFSQTKIHS